MSTAILLAVLALAAGLRGWGLDHGLPFLMGRPDEIETLRQTAGFAGGDLNPRWFVYPNLFFWLVWGWLELVLALRRLGGEVAAYGVLLAARPEELILLGRTLSAALGTATVAVVYAIGRRLGGARLGLIAATLLATCFLHVRDSHALKADVYLAFAVPVALWVLSCWAESGTRRAALWSGVAVGLATGIKYPGILLLAPGYHADRLADGRRPGGRAWVPSRRFWLFAATATVVFLAACPYLVLDRASFGATVRNSVWAVYGAGQPMRAPLPADASWLAQAWRVLETRTFAYHALVSLRWGCGALLAIATPVALAAAWRARGHPFWRIATAFTVVYYGVNSLSQVVMARYLTPLTPLLALLVARLLLTLVERLVPARGHAAALALLVAAVVAEPAARAVAYDRVAARTDTRVLATQWMATHLPPDAVVAVLGSTFFPIADPVLPPGRRRADLPLGSTDLDGHGVTHVVVHEHPLMFSRPIASQLARLRPHLHELALFSPWRTTPTGWFEPLDAHYIPFHGFAGVARPGPEVRIYRWQPPRSARHA